ncbi:stalk domain-containing protein [Paenibacillus solani]|uniref:stalk domain-containing protein n=1 Tax=Paenibacillus solani TaxID=1705565 RepID=UPI003D2798EC
MRKYVLALIMFGVLVVMGLIAYGASTSIDFVTSSKFVINGKSFRFPVINYNGNVYVPPRLVGEKMYAEVDYDENKELITIKQQSLEYDDIVEAPIPSIAYKNKYKDGTVWLQEIPLLQGSSCWNGCLDVTQPIGKWLSEAQYPPVRVKPGSDIVITYPAGMEPDRMTVFNVVELGNGAEQSVELVVLHNRVQLPKEPGIYHILVNSDWEAGFTSYAFAIHITDINGLNEK